MNNIILDFIKEQLKKIKSKKLIWSIIVLLILLSFTLNYNNIKPHITSLLSDIKHAIYKPKVILKLDGEIAEADVPFELMVKSELLITSNFRAGAIEKITYFIDGGKENTVEGSNFKFKLNEILSQEVVNSTVDTVTELSLSVRVTTNDSIDSITETFCLHIIPEFTFTPTVKSSVKRGSTISVSVNPPDNYDIVTVRYYWNKGATQVINFDQEQEIPVPNDLFLGFNELCIYAQYSNADYSKNGFEDAWYKVKFLITE